MKAQNWGGLERSLQIAVLVAVLATIPLMIAQEGGSVGPLVKVGDWAVWAIFVVEYVALFALTTDRANYVRGHWLSLAVIILSFPALPALFQLVRLVRIVRLARLALVAWRGVQALGLVFRRKGLVYVASVTVLLVLAGGVLLSILDPDTVGGDVGVGIWWAVVTATTVGYGDIAPKTPAGRLIGVAIMLAGIGLVSTLAAAVAAHFVGQEQGAGQEELAVRLDRLEEMIREIRDRQEGSR